MITPGLVSFQSAGGPAGFRVAERKWPVVKQRKYQGILIEQIVYFPQGRASKASGPGGDNVLQGHQSPNRVSGPFRTSWQPRQTLPRRTLPPTSQASWAAWRWGLWHQHRQVPWACWGQKNLKIWGRCETEMVLAAGVGWQERGLLQRCCPPL